MKTTSQYQGKRLLVAAAIGAALLSPIIAQSADERMAGQDQGSTMKVAMVNVRDYAREAEEHAARAQALAMEERWQAMQQTVRPDALVKLGEAFERDFPGSKYSEAGKEIQTGARKALAAVREARLSLSALEEASGDTGYRTSLTNALHGGKDEAYRVAMMYRDGTNGVPQNARRSEQWLQIASDLGNGHASWQLAQIYNVAGLVGDAARLEAKAVEAGYGLPVRLPSRGMNF